MFQTDEMPNNGNKNKKPEEYHIHSSGVKKNLYKLMQIKDLRQNHQEYDQWQILFLLIGPAGHRHNPDIGKNQQNSTNCINDKYYQNKTCMQHYSSKDG